MNRPSGYQTGSCNLPSQMINGNYYRLPAAPVYSASYQQIYLYPQPACIPIPGTQYVQQIPCPTFLSAPSQSSENQPQIPCQKKVTNVEKRPIAIIDPITKKNVLEDLLKESSLRKSAPEFVPHLHSNESQQHEFIPHPNLNENQQQEFIPHSNENRQQEFIPHPHLNDNQQQEYIPHPHSNENQQQEPHPPLNENHQQELAAQDTIVDEEEVFQSDLIEPALSLDSTVESSNPSLTASIKQIPSNLEQTLSKDVEIPSTKSFKATILPEKQQSHSSLPDAFHDKSCNKRLNDKYSSSPPASTNYFHQYHPRNFTKHERTKEFNNNIQNNLNRFPPPFRGRHPRPINSRPYNDFMSNNFDRNLLRTTSEKNLSTENFNLQYNYQNKNYSVNKNQNDHQKVDQECTAHPIKDLNQNYVISKVENSNKPKYDENNNEIIEDSVNLTESSVLESTGDNNDTSLDQSCRYTTRKLIQYRSSPLVLSGPPKLQSDLIDSSMTMCVWNQLFENKQRYIDYINEDNNRMSQFNKTCGNLRYENNHHNHHQLTRSKSGGDKQIIKLHLSLKEDVKLNKADNAWKPSHMENSASMDDESREMTDLIKNFRSLLNKITEDNFEHLVKEINDKRKYMINSTEKLTEIVKLLFEKSISEPGYASTYAKLCYSLSTVHLINEEIMTATNKPSNPWKKYLITHCQKEFERTKTDDVIFKNLQDRIKNATDAEEVESLEDVYFKLRQRANGTVKFIGELYKINMLTANIMMSCINVLLSSVTEENIERLCKLLTTVGEKLESELSNKSDMEKYMQQLSNLRSSNVITTKRIKFDIMNVIDLRKSNWVPRMSSQMTKPQKLQDLQEQENKKKKLLQQQLNDYQPKANQNNNNNNQNSFRGQRSQRSFDNDGYRINVSKQIDFNKMSIPKPNNAEMSLGPPRTFFQNFNKPVVQMQPPPTRISNPFGNLPTDCDDAETLPTLHHTRSGSNFKNNRKDKKNNSQSNGNNREKQKARTPSPVVEQNPVQDDEDEFFMIVLTDAEEKDMKLLADKMQQAFKGKITLDMMITDLKRLKITKNVLGQFFTDLFDKRPNERKELIELIGEICRKGLITKVINIEALKLAFKSIPEIICDVPLAYDYFSDYCFFFYDEGLITTMDELENICGNQENALNKIKEKIFKALETKKYEENYTKNTKSTCKETEDVSNETEELIIPSKPKNDRCLQKLMGSIQFELDKKQKNASKMLEKIYSEIDKDKSSEASNFIKDLTITILSKCYESKVKKNQKKIDICKLFPLFIRYIDSDLSSQIDCLNALNEFASNNTNTENCNLSQLFELFYENDVISTEAYTIWRKQHQNSQSNRKALDQTTSFFTKLDEADISDDFDCTSSTIKED